MTRFPLLFQAYDVQTIQICPERGDISMAAEDQLLSIVVSEEVQIASILSAEAVKASQTAFWITQIPIARISAQPVSTIVNQIAEVQNSISCVMRSAADKEISIASKVNAIKGVRTNICWTQAACPSAPTASEDGEGPSTGDLIDNGDFETGNFTGWAQTDSSVVAPTQVGVQGDPYSAFYVVEMASATSTISQAVGPIAGGQPVRLAFGAAGSTANLTLTLTLTYYQGATPISSDSKTNYLTPNNNYITFVYIFVPPTTADSLVLSFSRNAASGFINVDNVTLQAV
jgi:hypothetical protein